MRKFYSKAREYIPIVPFAIFALTLISLIVFLLVVIITPFADFFNYNVSYPFRVVISSITTILPFSLAEVLLILIPVWLALLIFIACRVAKKGKRHSLRFLSWVLTIPCFIFITFVWTYSSGYHGKTIDTKMGLDCDNITELQLYESANIIIDNLNQLSENITYDESGASVMPYSYREMSKKICTLYDDFEDEYKVLRNFRTQVKPIMLSKPMTYTHLSGIYSFMTGEANVNVNYPDYIVASSSAHELAHQRGIAREDECNLIAFVVLSKSEDDFLKYSAYLDVYSYIMNELYERDRTLYNLARERLCYSVKADLRSYSEFFNEYRNSKASQVTDKINNSYLQANGQENGTESYSMVTRLVCAYLTKESTN